MLGLTFVLSLAPEAPLTFSHMYAIDLCKKPSVVLKLCSSFVHVQVVTNKLSQELSYSIIFKLHAVCYNYITPRKSATFFGPPSRIYYKAYQ